MNVSEFIARLEEFRAEHGDLPVETMTHDGRGEHSGPELAHRKILGKRERRPGFSWRHDGPERKGDPVCRV